MANTPTQVSLDCDFSFRSISALDENYVKLIGQLEGLYYKRLNGPEFSINITVSRGGVANSVTLQSPGDIRAEINRLSHELYELRTGCLGVDYAS